MESLLQQQRWASQVRRMHLHLTGKNHVGTIWTNSIANHELIQAAERSKQGVLHKGQLCNANIIRQAGPWMMLLIVIAAGVVACAPGGTAIPDEGKRSG